MTMKGPHQITAVVLIIASVFFAGASLQLKFSTELGPGPGFFPFWLSMILGGLSAIQFYHATWGRPEPMPPDFFASRIGYLRALAAIAALVGTIVLLEPLGFRLTMLVFMLWLLRTLGCVNWVLTVIIALVTSFGGFWLFDTALKVPLPVGTFGI